MIKPYHTIWKINQMTSVNLHCEQSRIKG